MKKLALAFTALTALVAAPAMAADIPIKAPAPLPEYFNWTGFYAGIHGGAGWQSSSFVNGGPFIGNAVIASGVGVLGGVQAGYNVQWRQFVIGLEAEFWGSTLNDRSAANFTTSDGFFTYGGKAKSRNLWDAALSVRSGVTFDRAFVYGKLGAVLGRFDYKANSYDFEFDDFSNTTGRATFLGVLLGVGFEYALTNNWTTKFEYNYIDYGNKLVNFTTSGCDGTDCGSFTFSTTIKEIKQIAKLGVNYKFSP